jgi:hypothetical protein
MVFNIEHFLRKELKNCVKLKLIESNYGFGFYCKKDCKTRKPDNDCGLGKPQNCDGTTYDEQDIINDLIKQTYYGSVDEMICEGSNDIEFGFEKLELE